MSIQRNSDGIDGDDGARPKYGVLAQREYGLLAPEEPAAYMGITW